ncbi:MAG: hypothetical protein HOC71_14230 [Candidatus Latescibacteria bacterium]|nr:hypothetical protein [Candidatus Latescibacterota bacterium]
MKAKALIIVIMLGFMIFETPGDTHAVVKRKKIIRKPAKTVVVNPAHKTIGRLPSGHSKIVIGGHVYYHNNGVFYKHTPSGYVIVSGPMGAKLKVLPAGSITVRFGPVTYHYHYGTYYRYDPVEKIYNVVEPLNKEVVEDVLILTDGETLTGQFLGGNQETIDFQVGDDIYEIQIYDIVSVTFSPQVPLTEE